MKLNRTVKNKERKKAMPNFADKLYLNHNLTDEEFKQLLETDEYDSELYAAADEVRRKIYGTDVYIRGLIEISSFCKNDCYYCGIRRSNKNASRYRLEKDEILSCCREGYRLGFRTFVMQGGEDAYYTDEIMCDIVSAVRGEFPDCAITLSLGERSYESFKKLYDAGANRYLLRHETASGEHYSKLHPKEMSLENRKECLFNLKKIGYQTGSGFMVGSPYQTSENLIEDIRFLQKLRPDMIGIGPFVTHSETPFSDKPTGSLLLTLRLLAILRLCFPNVLLPATTALGTIHPQGREMGLKAGANVVMPNLSPLRTRELYKLYDGKICTGEEAAQCIECLKRRVSLAGYEIVTDIGNVKKEMGNA